MNMGIFQEIPILVKINFHFHILLQDDYMFLVIEVILKMNTTMLYLQSHGFGQWLTYAIRVWLLLICRIENRIPGVRIGMMNALWVVVVSRSGSLNHSHNDSWWVIKCPHWTSPNHDRYMVYNGYFSRWCPIFPKWDSYQPLFMVTLMNSETVV